MKSRPILFSGVMVNAILAGKKTQTRRLLNPQPAWDYQRAEFVWQTKKGEARWSRTPQLAALHHGLLPQCPYGQVGDQLWVRENLRLDAAGFWVYAADRALLEFGPEHEATALVWAHHKDTEHCPSIHMPRWASRITLEVTAIRVERLQDISEQDALAEGVTEKAHYVGTEYGGDRYQGRTGWFTDDGCYRGGYGKLWDSINPQDNWLRNPWVWVVEFKRVEA